MQNIEFPCGVVIINVYFERREYSEYEQVSEN